MRCAAPSSRVAMSSSRAAVYGGAYSVGDAYEFSMYDGTNLALTQNVIVVARQCCTA